MRHVAVFKAQENPGQIIEPVTIIIAGPIPHDDPSWADPREPFDVDAHRLADALASALPGGTLDALLRELLNRAPCMLRVPVRQPSMTGGAT